MAGTVTAAMLHGAPPWLGQSAHLRISQVRLGIRPRGDLRSRLYIDGCWITITTRKESSSLQICTAAETYTTTRLGKSTAKSR